MDINATLWLYRICNILKHLLFLLSLNSGWGNLSERKCLFLFLFLFVLYKIIPRTWFSRDVILFHQILFVSIGKEEFSQLVKKTFCSELKSMLTFTHGFYQLQSCKKFCSKQREFNQILPKNSHQQDSPPAWTQEEYHPPRSKYSQGGVPHSWLDGTPSWPVWGVPHHWGLP